MSAWFCGSPHVSILVNALEQFLNKQGSTFGTRVLADFAKRARAKNGGSAFTSDAEAVFADLIEENVLSLKYRYPDDETRAHEERVWSGADSAVYNPNARARNAEDAIRLAQSFRYQACEHDGWKKSLAHEFVMTLVWHLADETQSPHWANARWSVDEDEQPLQPDAVIDVILLVPKRRRRKAQ